MWFLGSISSKKNKADSCFYFSPNNKISAKLLPSFWKKIKAKAIVHSSSLAVLVTQLFLWNPASPASSGSGLELGFSPGTTPGLCLVRLRGIKSPRGTNPERDWVNPSHVTQTPQGIPSSCNPSLYVRFWLGCWVWLATYPQDASMLGIKYSHRCSQLLLGHIRTNASWGHKKSRVW